MRRNNPVRIFRSDVYFQCKYKHRTQYNAKQAEAKNHDKQAPQQTMARENEAI